VLFKLTESRESSVVHDFLAGYRGVLVSDFYPGYDAIACSQQKCLVHLIREINEDLWKHPFNEEFEAFSQQTKDLFSPMFDAINRHGMKKRNLKKFTKDVEKFYKKSIDNRSYELEATIKYQKRFQRYKNSLFTFLEQDSIPWNNNMAERAIRHLAVQRKISGTFHKDATPAYLSMLGIGQTCRFQQKSFLKFLLSGEKDLDSFKVRRVVRPRYG
jgi:hypothetical protein